MSAKLLFFLALLSVNYCDFTAARRKKPFRDSHKQSRDVDYGQVSRISMPNWMLDEPQPQVLVRPIHNPNYFNNLPQPYVPIHQSTSYIDARQVESTKDCSKMKYLNLLNGPLRLLQRILPILQLPIYFGMKIVRQVLGVSHCHNPMD